MTALPSFSSFSPDIPRCQHRTRNGRCTMPPVNPAGNLCYDHARMALHAGSNADYAKFLTQESDGFQTAAGINSALGNLYMLLAKGRISPRRAAVLAHISNLLLRTLPAIDKDISPDADRDLPDLPAEQDAPELGDEQGAAVNEMVRHNTDAKSSVGTPASSVAPKPAGTNPSGQSHVPKEVAPINEPDQLGAQTSADTPACPAKPKPADESRHAPAA